MRSRTVGDDGVETVEGFYADGTPRLTTTIPDGAATTQHFGVDGAPLD